MRIWLILLSATMALPVPAPSQPAETKADAELRAWSQSFAAWVDVTHSIACPPLQPRIDALTKRLGDVQDVFLPRHPDYAFPPMIFAKSPTIDCSEGARLVTRAEARALEIERLVRE